MTNDKELFSEYPGFNDAVDFHGHVCPGLAFGYKVSKIALDELSSDRPEDEEFVAIVENDSCSVDAVQLIAGCTFGKGNLIFNDYGKQVYTFINRNTNEAIRLSLKVEVDDIDPEFLKARKKANNPDDIKAYENIRALTVKKILDMDKDELFNIEKVNIEIPKKAKIFKSFECSKCGETSSEHRARVINGKPVCIPCFNAYLES